VASFLYGFWDLECYSSSGDFPLTKRDYSKIAKQLSEHTDNFNDCVLKLKDCFIDPNNPPKGFHGIYLKKNKTHSEIYNAIHDTKFSNALEKLYTNKNSIKKEEFTEKLTKVLNYLDNTLPIAGDPVIQIGIVLSQGTDVLDKHIFVYGSCDNIDGSTVHTYENEKEMIIRFFEFIDQKNPDIMIGYNVFGFDEAYIWHRAEELGIQSGNVCGFYSLFFSNLSYFAA
jgi:hypothetical protein